MDMITEIMAEVSKATAKFPTWPTDPLHALAVLGEEYGELTQAVLEFTYEPHKTSEAEIRKEALQTAAMAIRFCMSLHKYEFKAGVQHSQGESKPVPILKKHIEGDHRYEEEESGDPHRD